MSDMLKRIAGLAFIVVCPAGQAQVPVQPAEFEVVSIKHNKTNERMYYGLRNGSMTIRNMSVKGLIQIAYGKKDVQVWGGPAWISTEAFDIDAKAERPLKATHDMEKALLASRFQLAFHREMKVNSVYSLVVAKGGIRMKLSADQSEPEKGGPKEMSKTRLLGEGIPMYIVCNLLSNMLGRSVINNTGLAGKYDVNLGLRPDALPAPSESGEAMTPADVINLALIDAIEKQLGLKLESIKAPEEILVIDHIEHPTAN